MLPTNKIDTLHFLHWHPAKDKVTGNFLDGHRVDGKTCYWFDGTISVDC